MPLCTRVFWFKRPLIIGFVFAYILAVRLIDAADDIAGDGLWVGQADNAAEDRLRVKEMVAEQERERG